MGEKEAVRETLINSNAFLLTDEGWLIPYGKKKDFQLAIK